MAWDLEHPYIYMQEALSYRISDMDVSSNPRYYGYVDKAGKWMIVKEDTTGYTYRYIRGDSDYTTNWTGRALLSYDYYYNTF